MGLVWRTLKWLLITWHWSRIGQENGNRNRSIRQVGRDWAGAIWQVRSMLTRDEHTPRHQLHNEAFTRTNVQWNERRKLGNVFLFLDLKIRLQIRTQYIWSTFIILCYENCHTNDSLFLVDFFYVQTNLLKNDQFGKTICIISSMPFKFPAWKEASHCVHEDILEIKVELLAE